MADISKIKLANGTVVNIKDATARANITTLLDGHALEGLGDAAWKALAAGITDSDAGLPTAAQVKSYVDSQIELIPEFDVVVVADLPIASKDTFHKVYLVSGGMSGSYTEYITIRSGSEGNYTYSWERVGSLDADFADYVKKETTIATIKLDHNITVAELQTALGLHNMAYANTASGSTTLETVDSIEIKPVTVAGNATVTHTAADADLTKGDYTPAGTVTIAADEGGTQISGTVSKPSITVDDSTVDTFVKSLKAGTEDAATFTEGTFTPNVPTVIDVSKFNGGAVATWTGKSHTAAKLTDATTGSFATEGITATLGTGDDVETLIFTTAGTDNAVTDRGTFTPDSVDFGTFDGGTVASLETGFYTAGKAASKDSDSFNAKKLPVVGNTASAVTAVTAELAEAPKFTGDKFKATFGGTEAKGILVTGVSYDKADATAAYSATVTPETKTISRSAKDIDITVSPDAVQSNG